MTYTLGITRYFSIPYQVQSPNSKFDFLPMWQFTGLCVLLGLLVILFCMLLNMLFNAICRNKMTSLLLTLAILLLGMGIAQPANTGAGYAWLAFTYFNPVDILSGYTSYTYLNGLLTLGISCSLLYFITRWIFQKKDAA